MLVPDMNLIEKKLVLNDFASAGKTVLEFLHHRLGFELWMITRTENEDWIVLTAEDHGYQVKEGMVFRWSDSFCSRMVNGLGPCIAPKASLIPAYAEAPIGQQVNIGAYIGVPLRYTDGSLFGTLCAIDPSPKANSLKFEQPLIELLANLLSNLLNFELKTLEALRQVERVELEAMSDALTGLYNRKGWNKLVAMEEERCSRYGHSACIFSIDLDDLKYFNDTYGHEAGDQLLIQASLALKNAVRESDIVARLGGDEFSIMTIECDQKKAKIIEKKIIKTLELLMVKASIGFALRKHQLGLKQACQEADMNMYKHKNNKKLSKARASLV